MFRRYKEVWCGVVIGIGIWAFDAILHASGEPRSGFGTFARELITSDPPRLLFRILFLIVSTVLGHCLRQIRERERRVLDLQMTIDSLRHQMVNPLLLIVGYSSSLALKEGRPASRETVEMVSKIQINARKVNELINQWPVPSDPRSQEAGERVFQR